MWVLSISLTILGMILGIMIDDVEGFLWGACLGFLAGMTINLHRKVNSLSFQVKQLSAKVFHTGSSVEDNFSTPAAVTKDAIADSTTTNSKTPEPIPKPVQPVPQYVEQAKPVTTPAAVARASNQTEPDQPLPIDILIENIRRFFTEGNVVLKVGLIVLFFGVAFLLKYAAERNILSIEVRLVGVMIGALIMLVLGWRWREKRMMYGITLQGGAIGIMFITVFVAAKLYGLIPLLLALVVMLGLVGFCAALAIMQNAMWLAVLGILGGFLAPVLASTGSGNHVMLFSYYALLNLGIFAIAWYKSWRILNLLGFTFTLLIGGLWAESSYKPELFATTEPFLIFFFLLFTAIAVIYALRQPTNLKGMVDATLVFGTPIVAFGLQSAMVSRFEYGVGFSALAMGALYILLAIGLWRRKDKKMRVLTESFLALGVVFASLAIPLTLSGSWTTMAWALEGAAIVWIGVRQQRVLARGFGLLLQAGAGLTLLSMSAFDYQTNETVRPLLNDTFIGLAMVAVAGLLSAFIFYRNKAQLLKWEHGFDIGLLVWGVAWWLYLGWNEMAFISGYDTRSKIMLLFMAASCYLFYLAYRRLSWQHMVYPALLLIPYACLAYLTNYSYKWGVHYPLKNLGYLAWPAVIVVSVIVLHGVKEATKQTVVNIAALLLFWLTSILLTWQAGWSIEQVAGDDAYWRPLAELMTLVVIVWFVINQSQRGFDYFGISNHTGLLYGLSPVMLFFVIWLLAGSFFYTGETQLIPYIPVLNPFGLGCAFALMALLYWCWQLRRQVPQLAQLAIYTGYILVPILAFIALNSSLARAIHQWTGVAFTFDTMFGSMVFQASISILWTVLAMVITMLASRTQQRLLWFVGMSLMVLVIVKLFLFDLSNTNTLARVISFLGVGLLMLVMGYFSPLPPHKEEAA